MGWVAKSGCLPKVICVICQPSFTQMTLSNSSNLQEYTSFSMRAVGRAARQPKGGCYSILVTVVCFPGRVGLGNGSRIESYSLTGYYQSIYCDSISLPYAAALACPSLAPIQ